MKTRNTGRLVEAAARCKATRTAAYRWEVVSGDSGETYHVELSADGVSRCTCAWGRYHQKHGAICKHTIAAWTAWMAEHGKTLGLYNHYAVKFGMVEGKVFGRYDGMVLTSK